MGAHRVSHTHRTHVGVGFISILVSTAAEGLGAGQQLYMRLNSNHSLILQHTHIYAGAHSRAVDTGFLQGAKAALLATPPHVSLQTLQHAHRILKHCE